MPLLDELPELAALGARTAPRAARYALPWEEPQQRPANRNTNRATLPWEAPATTPARGLTPSASRVSLPWETTPAPGPGLSGGGEDLPPELQLPKESPGLLSQIGDVLDRPGNAFRGLISGNLGALKGLLPFSESLGLFGDDDRVSGQDVLQSWGVIDEADPSLFSGKGMAGLGLELVADPLNLLFGAGMLTKAGKAAKLVGGGLSAADKALDALKAGKAIEEAMPWARLGEDVLSAGGKAAQQVGPATSLASPVAKAGQYLKGAGLPMELAQDWTTAGRQGQRAALGVGGDYAPLIFGPTVQLPEKILAQAPEFLGALQAGGKAVKALPGVKHAAQLFSKAPAGLSEEQAVAFEQALRDARKAETAGIARATEEAEGIDAALRVFPEIESDLVPPELAGKVDLETGEVLEQAPPTEGKSLAELIGVAPPKPEPIPGPVPDATNPAFIRDRYRMEREKLLKPWEAAAPERLAAESAKARNLARIEDAGLERGLEVLYTPAGSKKPRRATISQIMPDGRVQIEYAKTSTELDATLGTKAKKTRAVAEIVEPSQVRKGRAQAAREARAGELADVPPELRQQVRAIEQDTNRAIDAAHWRQLEEMKAAANDPDAIAHAERLRKSQLRAEFAGQHGKFPLETDPIKGKATALPKAIEAALEAGAPPELMGLKGVDFLSADAAGLMPGDKLRLGGDTFRVLPDSPAGKVRLKDGHTITVPDEAVPFDKGTQLRRAEPVMGFDPQAVIQGLEEDAAARAMPESAAFLKQIGQEAQPKNLLEQLEEIAGRGEAQRLAKRQARNAATKQAVEGLPPELQAAVDDLTRKEAEAVKRAEAAAKPSGPLGAIAQAPRKPARLITSEAPEVIPPRSASAEQAANLRRIKAAEANLARTRTALEREGVPTNDPRWQAAERERQHWQAERLNLEQEIRTGKGSPIGAHPSQSAIERAYQGQDWQRKMATESKLTAYMAKAGTATRAAAREAARMLPEASPAVQREITDAIELAEKRGVAPAKIRAAADAFKDKYERIHEIEQEWTVPTTDLDDPRVQYTTRVATKTGSKFLRGLKPAKRGHLFRALAEMRTARGVKASEAGDETARHVRIPDAARQQMKLAASRNEQAAKMLASLDADTRQWIEDHGLVSEFLAFGKNAENIHPSQIQRIPQFRGLTIGELNDAFKRVGAKGDVFHQNPAAQVFARTVRHVRGKIAHDLFKQLERGLGKQLPKIEKGQYGHFEIADGISEVRTPQGLQGYAVTGIDIDGKTRALRLDKAAPVVLPDRQTAEAVQKAMVKLLTPEEAGPVLEFWDAGTRMWKGWVTRAFPAYHVRNRMGNRIQSWLEDVPVAGSHYKAANRVMSGQAVEVTTGTGEVLTRDDILREATDQGLLQGGFFEAEFKKTINEKASLNPLQAESRPLLALERASSAMVSAPGQILSGGGVKALRDADAQMVEGTDRLGHYLYKRMKGFTPEAAAENVNKALFDYADISDFEKNVVRRVVPFYTWTRKAIPFVLDRILNRPGKIRALTQVSGGAGGPREGLPEHMPSWMREGLPVPLGKDAEGNALAAYGFGTPIEGAVDPLAGFAESGQRGLEKLLNLAHPAIKFPLELATDRRFFLGQSIRDSNKAPHFVKDLPPELQDLLGAKTSPTKAGGTRTTMDPYLLHLLESLPGSRAISSASKAADERKPAVNRLLNLLSGIKSVSIDEERQAGFARRDAAKARLAELERAGLVFTPDVYAATAAGKESPESAEVKELLRILRGK